MIAETAGERKARLQSIVRGEVSAKELPGAELNDQMRRDWKFLARFNRDVMGWSNDHLQQLIDELKAWALQSHEDWCHVRDYLAAAGGKARKVVREHQETPSRNVFTADKIEWKTKSGDWRK